MHKLWVFSLIALLGSPLGFAQSSSLPTTDGGTVSLSVDPTVRFEVICFLGTECPLAKIYAPRLQRLADRFAEFEIRFIGINSNVQDSMEELAQYGSAHQLTFPLAKDYDRSVARTLGATRTPEVFVVDRSGAIRYQGRIDDQFEVGVSRKQATRHDLRVALEELVADKPVSVPRTTAAGCLITLPKETAIQARSDVTFCDQVIRVLQQHCVECHRDGEIAPFSLSTYEEAVGWAEMSLEVIEEGRMPPWHASPDHGEFRNARHMAGADKQILRRWVESGLPYGDAAQLPEPPPYVSGWRLSRQPDLVLPINDKAFNVPADGTVEYQYFVVDPGFTEERWVRAAQVIPGNPAVVHHCIAFTRPPDGGDFRDISLLSAYVPGQIRRELPDGYAQRIAPGAKIVFQMHYTPTGKPEQDLTRLGLVFADAEDVTHEVYALGGINHDFEIPPGANDYGVEGTIDWFPKNGSLLAITPHMHLRGKSFRFQYRPSNGESTILLDVPAYDFNWQHNYELTEPLALSSIDELSFTARFDNSPANPHNPDPTEFVTWGDQTWQEMALAFITVAQPIDGIDRTYVDGRGRQQFDDRSLRMLEEAANFEQQWQQQQAEWRRQAQVFARRYMKRFDRNQDGFVSAQELPDSVRMFSYWSMDHDNDERISLQEVEQEALQRAQDNRLP